MTKRYIIKYYPKREELEKEEEKSSFFMDAGIILTILTASSYLVAFSYEKGYKSYYGLNEMFLSNVGIDDILIAMTSIYVILLVLYNIYNLYSLLMERRSENPIAIAINFRIAPTAFLLIILGLAVPKDLKISIGVGIAILFIILWVLLIRPYLFVRNKKGYKNRMEKYIQNIDKTPYMERAKLIYKHRKIAFAVTLFFFVFSIATFTNLFGFNQARIQQYYMVITQNHKTYVVIGNQDGNFILAPLTIKSGVIKSEFIIVEGKSELSKPMVFQKKYFKSGLKVE